MKRTTRFSSWQLTSAGFDAQWGRLVCFACGLAVLLLGFWKLDRLELSEGQILLAVLLILLLALSCVVLGQLLWLSGRIELLSLKRPERVV